MTQFFLAYTASTHGVRAMQDLDWVETGLGLLVSFYYLDSFNKEFPNAIPTVTRTMLDSGAYSAYNSGKQIDIEALIQEAKTGRWGEVVSLDVIGDAVNSLKNALYMKEKGCTVMPVFHIGEPYEVLKEYCQKFDRVGLSCRFGETITESFDWLDECFRREYPNRFHSFGWMARPVCMRYPFETADSSSWALAPQAFNTWKAYGGRAIIKGKRSLLPEIEFYVKLQREVQHHWKKEMRRLDEKRKLQSARKEANGIQAV